MSHYGFGRHESLTLLQVEARRTGTIDVYMHDHDLMIRIAMIKDIQMCSCTSARVTLALDLDMA